MSGSVPYIGSKISLITTSDIRYEGILYTLNREESTIAVQNVRSFGTEGRRLPEVPVSNEIYDFIIFRGKDLKDLTVLQSQVGPEYPLDGHSGQLYSPPDHCSYQPAAPSPAVGFQRPSMGVGLAPQARNGFSAAPFQPNSYAAGPAYPSPASSASRPPEKPLGAPPSRQSFAPEHGPLAVASEPRVPLYEESNGVGAPPRPALEEAKVPPPRQPEAKERPPTGPSPPAAEAKDQKAPRRDLADGSRTAGEAPEVVVKVVAKKSRSTRFCDFTSARKS